MKTRARENLCIGLFIVFLTCGVAHATYVVGDSWDFSTNFSTSQNQAQDKEHNVAWEYRGGVLDQNPSAATLLTAYDSTAGAWLGSTSPYSQIGKGFMKAYWESSSSGDLSPTLVWDSNIKGTVHLAISTSSQSQYYLAKLYWGDSLLATGSPSYSGGNWVYSFDNPTFSVNQGDKISLKLGSTFPGQNPLIDVGFNVAITQVASPEPMSLSLLALGAGGLIWRRQSRA